MMPSITYKKSHEISRKLSIFDVTAKELQGVALEAVSARNEATRLHPSNAAGTFSYMAGVAALRVIFLKKKGWEITKHKGVEAVGNMQLSIVILFQNVDYACGKHDPNPISRKGNGVAELVANPSGYLWDYMAEEDKNQENKHAWFFCVSCNGDEVKAEISRPRAINNGNFSAFAERIFIIQDSDWSPIVDDTEDFEDKRDFDIPVTKKE